MEAGFSPGMFQRTFALRFREIWEVGVVALTVTCECFPGFSLVNPYNKLDGCKQNITQKCEPGGGSNSEDLYEKHELSNTFWTATANFEKMESYGEDLCWKSCSNDCNCVIAVLKEGSCWKKKLPLSNGSVDRSNPGKTFIKVPKNDDSSGAPPFHNPNREKKDQGTMIIVGSILLGRSVFLNFLLAAAISLHRSYSRKNRHELTLASSILETNVRSFTYEQLKQATDGFREELGRGAFGTVHKGVLSSSNSGTQVSVKKLNEFGQEVERI